MAPNRILITGASGFLGARTAELLVSKGHSLALLLRKPEEAWRVKDLLPQVEVITGDMGDKASYDVAFKKFRPDMLLHAGWAGVTAAERNAPIQETNIKTSIDLLETAIDAGIKHFIGIGSQAEYGPLNRKINEDAPTGPTTMYGQSKLTLCQQAAEICGKESLRFAWVRLFSAYGPRDNPDWLIPSMIRKILAGEKPSLTACEQLWDFVHIDDAAAAVAAVTETQTATGIFNLGGGAAPPLRQTITLLRDLVNPKAPLGFGEIAYRPDQVMHLEADITRLMAQTGWQPRVPLSDGLKETVDWFRRR